MNRTQTFRYFLQIALLLIITGFIACSNDDDGDATEADIQYFRVKGCAAGAHGNWQDTSFIIATRNREVIAQCREELAKPLAARKRFPFGEILPGNASYNKNASFAFNWHYDETNWKLAEVSAEVYDGCPYSDVHTGDWANTLKRYGGWGNRIAEEVTYAKGR